jgi:dTMP kinase
MFITFEGIEGSGKTTQLTHISEWIRSTGRSVCVTREPGGTPLGAKIRALLLDPENHGICPESELLLYTADRAQHLWERVMPELKAGKVILCDRYLDATAAYQGAARGITASVILQLHQWACKGLMPDITFLFDLPVETGLSRAWRQIDKGGRSPKETRFEKESLEFHRKVREGYLSLAAAAPDRFHVIDADRSEKVIGVEIIDILRPHFR